MKRKGNKDKNAFRRSKEWKNFSKKLRAERPCCELCGTKSKTLQVHHMDTDIEHYTDISDPSRFMVLCRACHSYIERLAKILPQNRYKYNPVWVAFCSRAFI